MTAAPQAQNARFGQPEVGIGIMPGGGATQRLTRAVGKFAAMKILLCGERFSATEAAAMGLAPTADPLGFKAFGWTFRRRWVCWIAHGPPIPLSVAEDLWQSHGGALRVDGHCGSPRPLKPVDHYHIDTPQSLRHLVVQLLMNQAGVPVESNTAVKPESTVPTDVESNSPAAE